MPTYRTVGGARPAATDAEAAGVAKPPPASRPCEDPAGDLDHCRRPDPPSTSGGLMS